MATVAANTTQSHPAAHSASKERSLSLTTSIRNWRLIAGGLVYLTSNQQILLSIVKGDASLPQRMARAAQSQGRLLPWLCPQHREERQRSPLGLWTANVQ
jgi:hypothetical protein